MELFCENSVAINYFRKKNFILDVWQGSKNAFLMQFLYLIYW